MLPQFSLCKKLNLLNSLCFPCLEKLTAKFPVFPVPWPPCNEGHSNFFPQLRILTTMYSKTCHLRSLFLTGTCIVRPLYEINILCNFADVMFILPLFRTVTCLSRPISLKVLMAVQSRFYCGIYVTEITWLFQLGSFVF